MVDEKTVTFFFFLTKKPLSLNFLAVEMPRLPTNRRPGFQCPACLVQQNARIQAAPSEVHKESVPARGLPVYRAWVLIQAVASFT